jgi:hypothetical protein
MIALRLAAFLRSIRFRLAVAATVAIVALPAFAAEQAPPAGLRVFYTGHSFHMFVPRLVEQMVKTARIAGHQLVGTSSIGGSRVIQHWDRPEAENTAKAALKSGRVDVFTMAAHLAIPDAGIENFVNLGLEHNPKLRLLVQGSWFPFDVPDFAKRITDNAQRDTMKIEDLRAAMQPWRTKLEAQVDDINKKHGRRVLYIVPVGEAVVRLREMIVAGKFPGITQQSKLFRDAIGHGNGHVMALASYCNYAVIYGRSPAGLNVEERSIDPAQHAILQQIAWDVVSQYPYAGVMPVKESRAGQASE